VGIVNFHRADDVVEMMTRAVPGGSSPRLRYDDVLQIYVAHTIVSAATPFAALRHPRSADGSDRANGSRHLRADRHVQNLPQAGMRVDLYAKANTCGWRLIDTASGGFKPAGSPFFDFRPRVLP
jgi:hypothetical protein